MADTNKPGIVRPADDLYCWVEQDSSVMLKAVTRFGDPVELVANEARAIAAALVALADRLEPLVEQHAVPGAAPDRRGACRFSDELLGGRGLQVAKPFWKLTRGGVTLAYLRPDGKLRFPELDGHFTVEAAFEPTPAYEPVRHLFEREVEIADEEGEAEQAEWSAIWEELAAPGLFVESPDGEDRWDILWIHVRDGGAWWWPLHSSPKTVLGRSDHADPGV